MTPHPLHRLCKALLAGGPQHMQRADQSLQGEAQSVSGQVLLHAQCLSWHCSQ